MQSRDKAVKFSVNNSKKTVTRHQAEKPNETNAI